MTLVSAWRRRPKAPLLLLLVAFSPHRGHRTAQSIAFSPQSTPGEGSASAMARRRRGGKKSASEANSSPTCRGNGKVKQDEKERNRVIGKSQRPKRPDYDRRAFLVIVGMVILVAISAIAVSVGRLGSVNSDVVQENAEGMPQQTSDTVTPDVSDVKPDKSIDVKQVFVGAKYEVLEVIPHDTSAFTQGLTFFGGNLYEGTGLYGESQIRELNCVDGSLVKSKSIDGNLFGEGIAHFQDRDGVDRIIQLTWKDKVGYLYDAKTFEELKEFTYETKTSEGWGITFDPESNEFIVSDGSSWLFFWDRDTLEEKRRVEVRLPRLDKTGAVKWLSVQHINELEYVQGRVLANVWYQDVLLSVHPKTGHVEKVYDFSELYKDRAASADCFNGISVSGMKGELYVTGKKWPYLYRIRLLD